eukprot:GDKJ01004141.1.p1 GENE.GDKJ01004141.1~~GDKJ01004141.1.p1  ORF type:complete len:1586 (-),score=422.28 GDKJ01004141.1:43-4215(-)
MGLARTFQDDQCRKSSSSIGGSLGCNGFNSVNEVDGGVDGGGLLTEYVVTRWYRAPEVMLCSREYGKTVDIWALGCVMGEIYSRKCVFPGRNYIDQLKLIVDVVGSPSLEEMDFITNDKAREFVLQLGQNSPKNLADVFPNASPEGRDLLSKMLTFDPRKRITAAQALEHPYFADLYSVTKQSRGYVHSRNVNSAREVFPFRSTDRLLITRAEIEEALYTVLTDFRSWMPKSLYSSYKPSNDIAPLHPQLAGVPCQDHYLRTMRTCSATTSKSSNSSSSSSSTHHPSNLSTNGATTQSLQQQQQPSLYHLQQQHSSLLKQNRHTIPCSTITTSCSQHVPTVPPSSLPLVAAGSNSAGSVGGLPHSHSGDSMQSAPVHRVTPPSNTLLPSSFSSCTQNNQTINNNNNGQLQQQMSNYFSPTAPKNQARRTVSNTPQHSNILHSSPVFQHNIVTNNNNNKNDEALLESYSFQAPPPPYSSSPNRFSSNNNNNNNSHQDPGLDHQVDSFETTSLENNNLISNNNSSSIPPPHQSMYPSSTSFHKRTMTASSSNQPPQRSFPSSHFNHLSMASIITHSNHTLHNHKNSSNNNNTNGTSNNKDELFSHKPIHSGTGDVSLHQQSPSTSSVTTNYTQPQSSNNNNNVSSLSATANRVMVVSRSHPRRHSLPSSVPIRVSQNPPFSLRFNGKNSDLDATAQHDEICHDESRVNHVLLPLDEQSNVRTSEDANYNHHTQEVVPNYMNQQSVENQMKLEHLRRVSSSMMLSESMNLVNYTNAAPANQAPPQIESTHHLLTQKQQQQKQHIHQYLIQNVQSADTINVMDAAILQVSEKNKTSSNNRNNNSIEQYNITHSGSNSTAALLSSHPSIPIHPNHSHLQHLIRFSPLLSPHHLNGQQASQTPSSIPHLNSKHSNKTHNAFLASHKHLLGKRKQMTKAQRRQVRRRFEELNNSRAQEVHVSPAHEDSVLANQRDQKWHLQISKPNWILPNCNTTCSVNEHVNVSPAQNETKQGNQLPLLLTSLPNDIEEIPPAVVASPLINSDWGVTWPLQIVWPPNPDEPLSNDQQYAVIKKLNYILRHAALALGLRIREDGYVVVDELLQLSRLQGLTSDRVHEVVRTCHKRRYEMREETVDGSRMWLIRAAQGHTISNIRAELLLKKVTDYRELPKCLHGTFFINWLGIRQVGLHRMRRNHIHFACGLPEDDGVTSSMRRTSEVVIYLDVRAAMRDGIEFLLSSNGVILSSGLHGLISPAYFASVWHLEWGVELWEDGRDVTHRFYDRMTLPSSIFNLSAKELMKRELEAEAQAVTSDGKVGWGVVGGLRIEDHTPVIDVLIEDCNKKEGQLVEEKLVEEESRFDVSRTNERNKDGNEEVISEDDHQNDFPRAKKPKVILDSL